MPKIFEESRNGAQERVKRLGLDNLLNEVRKAVSEFELLVEERKDANGGKAVRQLIDDQFEKTGGWQKHVSGDIDWLKCQQVNGTRVCLGVEVQFSARSDSVIIDVVHLRNGIEKGEIDVGVIVVPSDRLSVFLTDRGPSISDARRMVHEAKADDLPLILMALEHDGAGPPLPKQAKKSRK